MALSELLHWWNIVFLAPMALAILLLLVSAVTGLGDADADLPGEMHAEADADGGAEGEGDTGEGEAEADHPLAETLRAFGVGTVPVSLLLQAFLLFFGVGGLAANRLLQVGANPEVRILGALGIALVGGLGMTAVVGAAGRRLFPKEGPTTGAKDLIARTGRAVFAITDAGGTIQVRDAGGTIHQVAARVLPGQPEIEAGRIVLLVARDPETGVFVVEESPFLDG